MKELIGIFLQNIALKLALFMALRIRKVQQYNAVLLLQYAYIEALKHIEDKKLNYCMHVALFVKNELLGFNDDSIEIEEKDAEVVRQKLKENHEVEIIVSNYYLLEAYKYRYFNQLNFGFEYRDNAIEKAKKLNDEAVPLDDRSYTELKKSIRLGFKKNKKIIRQLSKQRIEKEKDKNTKKISIKAQMLIFAVSLGSTLFLISGFVYYYFLLGNFHVHVSDFFGISDYISSSIEVILPSFISTIVMLFFMLFGYDDAITNKVENEQFEKESKMDAFDWLMMIMPYILVLGLVVGYFVEGKIQWSVVVILGIFLYFKFVHLLPIWKFIDNPVPVVVSLFAVIYFSGNMLLIIKEDIKKIRDGEYKPEYVMSLSENYTNVTQYDFIAANSSYVFMFNKENQKMSALPLSAIKYIDFKQY